MLVSRLFGLILRSLSLISALIVVGIVGHYLDVMGNNNAWPGKRFIYTEVVAGIAILASIILLIPTTWALTVVPFDFIMFVLWIVSFGLLVNYIAPMTCSSGWSWSPTWGRNSSVHDQCETWKTALAFIFISAMLWLLAALLGMFIIHRTRRSSDHAIRKRKWYRSHV